jgi:hypothetical protein
VFVGALELVLTGLVLEIARPEIVEGDESEYYLKVARTVVDIFLNGLAASRSPS